MDRSLKASVTTAASLAGIALLALAVGLPMMLNQMALLETEMAIERQVYIDMSNSMWNNLMEQGQEIRQARAAGFNTRERRQCKLILIILMTNISSL
jgi:hypothetical protein